MCERVTTTKRTPNLLLRKARADAQWTQEDVASKLHELAAREDGPDGELCVDAHMIGRWEKGIRTPRPRYRQLLCMLFDRTAGELGFAPQECERSSPIEDTENTL